MNSRLAFVSSIALLLTACATAQQPVIKWSPLKMEVPRLSRLAIPLRPKPKADLLSLSIGIPLRDAEGLKHFVDAVSNPKSPNYRQFISPEAVGQRFGQPISHVEQIKNYLSSQGIKIKLIAKNRLSILAEATVAQAEIAFHTSIVEYDAYSKDSANPQKRFGFTNSPSLPSTIAPYVSVIGGLENFLRPKHHGTLTYDQLRTLYNDVPLYSAGLQGQGRTVAISNWDGYRLSNIQLQYSHFNLPIPSGGIGSNVSVVSIGNQDGNTSTAQGEGDIDIQCVLGAAPLCNLIIYDNATQSDLVAVLTQELNDNKADLISESYGWATDGYNTLFEQVHQLHLSMSAQGITYLCASGDTGTSGVSSYQYPDEDPDVLTVGGTSVSVTNAGNRVSEVVWNDSSGAGGGGYSQTIETFNVLPSYQKGTGVPTNIPRRLAPDISLDADPYTGYQIYVSGSLFLGYGGTSCASPLAAGSLALVEQQLIAKGALSKDKNGNQRMGRINDLIYSFNGDPTVFFDVVSGNNGTLLNNSSSDAVPGWDTASGWGCPNFNGIINKILSIPSPSGLTLNPTTVIGGSASTGTVTLSQPAPSGGAIINLTTDDVSASVPSTVTVAAGASSATFTVSTVGINASTNVTITASAAGGSASAILTINPIQITALAINQTPVVGGNQTTGTVTLNGPAPLGGMGIALTSSNSAATVPLNIEVPAGQTTGNFTINTTGVVTATTVSISGSDGSNTVSANLVVNPASLAALSVSPSAVPGGVSATGTVTLNGVAGSSGISVGLSSSSGIAQVPTTVMVPAGASSTTFTVTTSVVQNSTIVTLTATQGGNNFKAPLTVGPVTLSGLSISPTNIQGGSSATGTVNLSGPAPNGGLAISLVSSDLSTSVPNSVTVAAGSTSATFNVTTNPVSVSTSVSITATQGTNTQKASITVTPAILTSLTLSPSSVIGGTKSTGMVTLSGLAGPSGSTISLSSNSAIATPPVTVMVPAGQSTASFQVTTSAVSSASTASITANLGSANLSSLLTITPANITGLNLIPNAVVGGFASTGTVFLNGQAPSGGVLVNLSSNSGIATVPTTVTVQAGQTSASFTVTTTAVTNDTPVTISANQGGTTLTATLTVQIPILGSLSLSPSSVIGGNSATGTISLVRAAPDGGLIVNLSSDNLLATVATTLTIPAGSNSGTFVIHTSGTQSATTANISMSGQGVTRTAALTINPATLSTLTVSPSNVQGGQSTSGTVTLSGQAPSTGVVVNLSSSSSSATVPASVKIAAGASQAVFSVTTKPVPKSITVTLTAKLGGQVQSAPCTINATGVQGITFTNNNFVGGSSATTVGTVVLTGPAPVGGSTVQLKSSNPKVIAIPSTVKVPAGASSATISVTHFAVTTSTTVSIQGTLDVTTSTAYLTVNPFLASTVVLTPNSVQGGSTASGSVTLNAVVGRGSAPIQVKLSSNLSVASVPATVLVTSGSSVGKFAVTTKAVPSDTQATISASLNSSSTQATLTVRAPVLTNFVISPASVKGSSQNIVTGLVSISGPAPLGGLTIALSSSNPSAAQSPASITIPSGKSSGTFRISHTSVSSTQSATISSVLNGITKTASLTVTP